MVWDILQKGNMTVYIEKLHGFKPHIIDYFFKNWSRERVSLHGVVVYLIEKFIAEIIGLPMEGIIVTKSCTLA